MVPVSVSSSWIEHFPGACMGFVEARDLPALSRHSALDEARSELEKDLRSRYGGMDRKQLRGLPAMRAFDAHFAPFGKTYHVLLQLESVAVKKRSIPNRLCAVTALFMAELKHGLVAAGHDMKPLASPFTMAASAAGERYIGFGDREIVLPANDMTLRDAQGILSSVLYGPQGGSPVVSSTVDVLYTIYSPAGAPGQILEAQLQSLIAYLRLYAPDAGISQSVYPGDTACGVEGGAPQSG